jgi:hypothetical protein
MNLWWDHARVYKPNAVAGNSYGVNSYSQFKNNYQLEVNFHVTGKYSDYYEPRITGRYYTEPYIYQFNLWGSTDRRKTFNVSTAYSWAKQPGSDQRYQSGDFYANWRIGRKLEIDYDVNFQNKINDRGYVDMTDSEDTIYFARRDVNTLQNILGASYAFNNKAGINLRIRHYWSGASNKEFFQLQPNGSLASDDAYTENQDDNYNAFNIDLVFKWIFSPGSEFSIAWKNSILSNEDHVIGNYFKNLDRTWSSDQINSISLRILYYIDYNNIRKKKA